MNYISNKKISWVKKNLFNSSTSSVISIFFICLLLKLFSFLISWLILNATWSGNAEVCRQSTGFCYPYLFEKIRFILFGFYPSDLIWRPSAAMILLISFFFYARTPERWSKKLFYSMLVMFFCFFWLMNGGIGLKAVPTNYWGGLPLTLMLSSVGIIFSYPFGIILALMRRGRPEILRMIAVGYIELIRGIPLISVLFMSSVMFPLFLPEGISFDKLLRTQVAIILFVSAYMAEVVRGGLASISKGQYEAAHSLGLSYFDTMTRIIIPQAITIVIPPTVNTAIGMFKDTSLVLIIALFDLLNTGKTSITDSRWLGFSTEAYVTVGAIYFVFCFSMSKYSRRLEQEFGEKEKS